MRQKRGKGLEGILWRIIFAVTTTEALTMVLLLRLHIIQPTPQYIIPISGMTIGNAMVVSGLFLNQMNREVQTSGGEIDALLSLGATPRQAIQQSLKRSIKSSMIPTIDGMKTVGLVQLPGMMTGMIVAGADPVEAVKYQILIMFAFFFLSCIDRYSTGVDELQAVVLKRQSVKNIGLIILIILVNVINFIS